MVTCLFLGGLTIATVPFVRNLTDFILTQIALGIFSAGLDVAGNAWLLELWEEKANVPMQGMHFAFAIGMTIAPLMATPFLSRDIREVETFDPFHTPKEFTSSSSEHIATKTKSNIEIPYGITAATLILSGILLLFVSFIVNIEQQERKSSTSDTKQLEDGKSCQGSCQESSRTCKKYLHPKYLVILSSLILCFFTGVEINSFSFLPDFAVYSRLHLSKKTGALMTSVLSGSFALFRGINILAATRFSSEVMLYSHFLITCIGCIFLVPAAMIDNVYIGVRLLWTSIIILGAGYSCMFPTVYAYLEERITVNTFMTGATIFAGSVSTIVTPLIVGFTIETYPLIFTYVSVVGLLICIVLFIGLFFVEKSHKRALNQPTITMSL